MSSTSELGQNGSCPSDYETALGQATQMGAVVVASAGNGGTPGATAPVEAPAHCSTLVPGVMAVVGLRNVGTKVGYSSFGPQATIAAPAGNCVQTSGDCLRSIETTTNAGTTVPGENGYTDDTDPNLGTSFSAPIVSGIAALMRSVNNNLTPSQLIARMQASATAFPGGAAGVPTCPANDATSGECVCPHQGSSSGNQCGTGMVNALSAVKAAQRPIGVIVIPAEVTAGSVVDASESVAGCGGSSGAPAPLSIVSYRWSASPSSLIVSGAATPKVTIDPAPGTLDADHHELRRQYRCGNRHGAREFRLERGAHIGRDPRDRVPSRLDNLACDADGERVVLPRQRGAEWDFDAHHHVREQQRFRAHPIELRLDVAVQPDDSRDARRRDHLHRRAEIAREYHDLGTFEAARISRRTAIAPSHFRCKAPSRARTPRVLPRRRS